MTDVRRLPIDRDGPRILVSIPPDLARRLKLGNRTSVAVVERPGGLLLRAPGDPRTELSIFYELWAKSVRTLHEMGSAGSRPA